ncbi:MAG TPA: DAK2 domain-containing protein [Streptomyces sp.]|nr:DAK2 domain-containing protein [Streptomyces sp.]
MAEPAVAAFDLSTLLRLCDAVVDALALAREEIDALNVYPVPDSDTGTNLLLTVESAREALRTTVVSSAAGEGTSPGEGVPGGEGGASGGDPAQVARALEAFARGALLGARGNSGVILSQIVGALVERLCSGAEDPPEVAFAEGLSAAAEAAYAAVGEPVEGTMLTVARAAADAAREAASGAHPRFGRVVRAAAQGARDALERTPEQLPVLADSGVVDAGGRGLCVVLDATERVLTGRRAVAEPGLLGRRTIPVPVETDRLSAEGPASEVMYLLDADDQRVPALRSRLGALGDSLVVVGGRGLWNVHVHVDDVGAAVEAGIETGRPYRIRVTHFAEQDRHTGPPQPAGSRQRAAGPRRGRGVVAAAAGAGLQELFGRAGATVVPVAPGQRPGTAELLAAIAAAGAAEVVLLPNDAATIPAAEAAARAARQDEGVVVTVVPTHAQVQGLAALAVHEPGRSFVDDVLEMTAAARHARSGAVTVATRRAITTGGPCEPGDALGMIEGDFVLVGRELPQVAVEVLERLLGGGGELVTLVAGRDGADLASGCAEYLSVRHPTVDVVVHEGGQERYPLLVGVE